MDSIKGMLVCLGFGDSLAFCVAELCVWLMTEVWRDGGVGLYTRSATAHKCMGTTRRSKGKVNIMNWSICIVTRSTIKAKLSKIPNQMGVQKSPMCIPKRIVQ